MKKIVTISREFGSCGGTIGTRLAQETGLEYYDKELILMRAGQGNVDLYSLIKWDESVPINFGFTQSLFDFYNRPLSERIFQAQKETIQKVAEKGNCIIVGRNANTILREYDHSLHVFIHADIRFRLERIKKEMPDQTDQQVLERIRKVDRQRKKYCTYHTQTTFGDSRYYDVCLDSSRLGVEQCVKILKEIILA